MSKSLSLLVMLLFTQALMARQSQPLFINNPYPKTISVSGSAEMEVVPDEIFVSIQLKEYQKKGESKKDLESIKNQFLAACKATGIADSLISISSYSGANTYYWHRRKKKNPDLSSTISYQVKFRSSKMMDDLVEKLDDEATAQFLIVSTSHSKITEFRQQLKIRAVQAAKAKGIYLTEAVGEKLGEAITINEPNEWQPVFYNALSNNSYENASLRDQSAESGPVAEIDFKKIKLRFEVTVVFALK